MIPAAPLPPMDVWISKRRLSPRFYAAVLALPTQTTLEKLESENA